jgi:hypothetical protein
MPNVLRVIASPLHENGAIGGTNRVTAYDQLTEDCDPHCVNDFNAFGNATGRSGGTF